MSGRPCNVCKHPNRKKLEAELAAGASNRSVAAKYGVGEKSIRRHKERHYTRRGWKRRDGTQTVGAEGVELPLLLDLAAVGALREQAQHVRRILLTMLEQHRGGGDLKGLAAIAGQAMRTIEFEARLDGLFDGGGTWKPGDGDEGASTKAAPEEKAPEIMTFRVDLALVEGGRESDAESGSQ